MDTIISRLTYLSDELLEQIDGGEECSGSDSALTRHADTADAAKARIIALHEMLAKVLDANPAFRLRPIGFEGSDARKSQELQIAVEDEAKKLLRSQPYFRCP